MPSGLILTVLATQNFRGHEGDDICFARTAASILEFVRSIFRVYNPVDTTEEVTKRLSEEEKKRFQEAIGDLANDASKALNTERKEDASELWRGQLGGRFPLIEDEENNGGKKQKKEDAALLATFYASRNPPKPWASN